MCTQSNVIVVSTNLTDVKYVHGTISLMLVLKFHV